MGKRAEALSIRREHRGDEVVLTRNRFILRLFRQNFAHVEGPRFEDDNHITYDVWNRRRDPYDEECVRIAFDRGFLREGGNDFARATLQALRDAKGLLLAARGGSVRGDRQREEPGKSAELGYEEKEHAALF